jgi:hypothetical protein
MFSGTSFGENLRNLRINLVARNPEPGALLIDDRWMRQ